MPLYDYRCTDCAALFERRHAIAEAAGECPTCGSARITRQLPVVAIQVKGGGRGRAAAEAACAPEGCARPGCPSARLN